MFVANRYWQRLIVRAVVCGNDIDTRTKKIHDPVLTRYCLSSDAVH